MAGTQINVFSELDLNAENMQLCLDRMINTIDAVSISQRATTAIPVLKAGSCFGINGALFYYDADETPSGTVSDDGVWYIKAVVTGSTCATAYTQTAPTWSEAKAGWYSTNDRYIAKFTKDGANYSNKSTIYEQRGYNFMTTAYTV